MQRRRAVAAGGRVVVCWKVVCGHTGVALPDGTVRWPHMAAPGTADALREIGNTCGADLVQYIAY